MIGKPFRPTNGAASFLSTAIQTGGRGRCTGRTLRATSFTRWYFPSYENRSPVQARRTISSASSKRSRFSSGLMPKPSNSCVR